MLCFWFIILLNSYFLLVHPVFPEENTMSRKKDLLSSLGEKRSLLGCSPIFMRTERDPIAKGLFCLNERSSGAVIPLLNALYLCQKHSNRLINVINVYEIWKFDPN